MIYTYHRETGEIVAYVWGKRDLATVKWLKARLKELSIRYIWIASDHWDSFVTTFKCCKQLIGKFSQWKLRGIIVGFGIGSGVDLGGVTTFQKKT